ncbi:MAG: hypothetical protein ACYCW6_21965 [Candidatus Xenobia bacterium]
MDTSETNERQELQEVQAIMSVLMERMEPIDLIRVDEREIIAYRMAEIFSAARNLYTQVLPRFVEQEQPEGKEIEDTFGEVRMNLLHIKDLIEEFEEAFLLSLSEKLEEQEADGDASETPRN